MLLDRLPNNRYHLSQHGQPHTAAHRWLGAYPVRAVLVCRRAHSVDHARPGGVGAGRAEIYCARVDIWGVEELKSRVWQLFHSHLAIPILRVVKPGVLRCATTLRYPTMTMPLLSSIAMIPRVTVAGAYFMLYRAARTDSKF